MNKAFIILIFLSFFTNVKAQNKGQVKGRVLDHQAEPLPFVNIFIMKSKDSTLVKATTSNLEGIYDVTSILDGKYYLKLTMVGFKTFESPSFIINQENPLFTLNPIKLNPSTQALSEVEVVAKKPFVEQRVDKTILNVENSIVASGNTLLEVLEKAPGVVVDRQNNRLKLKNKSGVQIMIDGRLSFLSEEALMQLLTNTNSEEVATVEIISNPSSKYDAAGNAGIINIKLKKNRSYGTNGNITTSLGNVFLPNSTKDLYRGSVNLSINHRKEKYNTFGTVNLGRTSFYNDNHLNRSTNYNGLKTEFDQIARRWGNGLYTNGRAGVDFFITKKTTIGIMADVNNWNGRMQSNGKTNINESQNNTTEESLLIPLSERSMTNLNFSTNINLKHEFNTKGKEVTFDLDYSGFRNKANQDFDNTFFAEEGNILKQQNQRNITPTIINIFATKVDFTLPTENKTKIEFGAKTSWVQTDNNFVFEELIDNLWQSDEGKTNHFTYQELVNAAYINIGHQWDKIGIQSGLRAEHTLSEGNSITLDKVVPRSYLSLFPTFFLSQKINKNHALRYSYSRRIGRPNYQQLNPFFFFLDPFTFERGNAFLNPQFTENTEVTYTLKDAVILSLGYAFTKDHIFDTIEQDDETRVTFQTDTNLEKTENFSANLSFPISVATWWMMQNNVSVYYNRYQDPKVSGGTLDIGQFAYNFYTSSVFTLKKGWSAQANMWYNSPNIFGIVRSTKPQYALNLGFQKTMLHKKGKLKLNANDVFLTSFFNGSVDFENIDLKMQNRWASRSINLSFTYNFGSEEVQSNRKRKTASEDLKNRASR